MIRGKRQTVATPGHREVYSDDLKDWDEDAFFDLDIKVLWVKKCKNVRRLHWLLIDSLSRIAEVPGD